MVNKNKKSVLLSDYKVGPYNLNNQGHVKPKQNNLLQFIPSLNKNENETLPSLFLKHFACPFRNSNDN